MEKFQLPPEYDTEELRKLVELFPQFWKESYFDFEEMKSYVSGIVPDDLQEKYSFTWHGKTESYRLLKKNSNGTLRPCKEESVNWDTTQNLYIEGDNLEVLKLIKHTYAGEHGVKMIYIDPPYNSNEDFIYDDKFMDSLDKYLEYTNQKGIALPEASGRYHTRWLNMMYPRLWLANYLLRDDGVIFISIDDREVTNLRKLCDEVFGEENFFAMLTRRCMHTVRNSSKDFNKNTDYVLVYAKSKVWYSQDKDRFIREKVDKEDNYRFDDNDGKGKYKLDPLYARNYAKPYVHIFNNGVKWEAPQGSYPRYSQESLRQMEANNGLDFNGKEPRAKRYLSQVQEGQPPDTYMREEKAGFNSEGTKLLADTLGDDKIFSQPKPIKLVSYLMSLLKWNDGDIILDFFSGSGTTAHAVMQLNSVDNINRHFIMVQLPESVSDQSNKAAFDYLVNINKPTNICEIGKERIRRAGKKILEEWQEKQSQIKLEEQGEQSPPDIGFRVFKLDKSNFRTWDDTPIERNEADKLIQQMELYANSPFVKGRSHEDIVYEVIRMNNYPLTTPILPIDINAGSPGGKKIVYGVGEDCDFIICLDVLIAEREAEELCKYRPGRILFTDSCFENTEIRINVEHTIRNINAKIKLKVV